MSCRTSKHRILLLIVFAQLSAGCNSYKFVPNGTVIDYDNYYYLNDSLKLSVYVPGDFHIYNHQLKKGVKVDKLYARDKQVLNHLNLKTQQVNLLFSAKPVVEPYYHFIALLRNSNNTDSRVYQPKYQNDTLLYYYRRLKTDKFEIAETLIPYHKNYIEFVHYNNLINDCQYCDIDEISMVNGKSLSQGSESNFNDLLNQHGDSGSYRATLIDIPHRYVLKNKTGLIMAFKLNSERNTKELASAKFLSPSVSHCELHLGAGNYLIQYTDLNHKLIWDENSTVK